MISFYVYIRLMGCCIVYCARNMTDISGVLTASFMEMQLLPVRLHGARVQNTVIYILATVKPWSLILHLCFPTKTRILISASLKRRVNDFVRLTEVLAVEWCFQRCMITHPEAKFPHWRFSIRDAPVGTEVFSVKWCHLGTPDCTLLDADQTFCSSLWHHAHQ